MTVIVVGSINMDLVFTGIPHLPLPGQTVSSATFGVMPGGKGANQASAAAGVGASVEFVSAVGSDDLGVQALADLRARGVGLDNVATVDGPTGVAAVLIEDSGENSIVVTPGANGTVSGSNAADIAASIDGDVVVLACLEIPVEAVLEWARVASTRGWTFVLNPAPAPADQLPPELLELTTVITPNQTELAALGSVESLLAAGIDTVVVTKGGDGASLFTADGSRIDQRAFPVTPVDTTGAGDAFNGAFAAALDEGQPLADALEFAAATGALSTLSVGARDALPTRAEVDALTGRAG